MLECIYCGFASEELTQFKIIFDLKSKVDSGLACYECVFNHHMHSQCKICKNVEFQFIYQTTKSRISQMHINEFRNAFFKMLSYIEFCGDDTFYELEKYIPDIQRIDKLDFLEFMDNLYHNYTEEKQICDCKECRYNQNFMADIKDPVLRESLRNASHSTLKSMVDQTIQNLNEGRRFN